MVKRPINYKSITDRLKIKFNTYSYRGENFLYKLLCSSPYCVDTEDIKIIDINQTSSLKGYKYLLKLCDYILTSLEIQAMQAQRRFFYRNTMAQ